MPTYEISESFRRDFQRLTPDQRRAFKASVLKFVADLRRGAIRQGFRVKRFQGEDGLWEFTWAPNGRALFRYGASLHPGDPHVIWLRVGGHEIFEDR